MLWARRFFLACWLTLSASRRGASQAPSQMAGKYGKFGEYPHSL